ncbi:MAG: polyprenyl synthetase family protein [Pseudomonadota bacterium]
MPNSNNDIFAQINNSIANELDQINQIIIASAKGKAELIAEITNHLVLSGGKRVRPILTVLAAKLCGYNSGIRHCNLAAAVELIHTATLLHDDVVDGSALRRGKKTANSIWDNKASILVGDYLLSVAFGLMVKDGSLEVLDTLSKTSGIMADGEVMQLMNSNDINIGEEKYLEIISYKTAILFSAATVVGALITNSSPSRKKALADFGNNLGIAFQIMDDVLDYNADEKTLGKKIGNDFFEGKITLPIILTYKQATDSEKSKIKELFANNLIANSPENDQQYFAEIMTLIKKYNGIEKSINKALFYQNLAAQNLEIFDNDQEKSMLLAILEYGISRKN